MARIRTIKPEFWDDEKLSELPMQARLIFIGTWNFADDFGVIINSPKYIKSKLFPYDETLREHQVKTWLDALVNARFLIPFEHESKSYLHIRTFESHQLIDKRYTKSILPKGILASEILAGLEKEQTTLLSHSEHIVTTSAYSNSKVSVNGKESKVSVCPHVNLFDYEIEKLKMDYGEEGYSWMINKLSAYKGSSGKKYKSDYLAILNWVVESYNQKKEKGSGQKEKSHQQIILENAQQGLDAIDAKYADTNDRKQ